MIGSLALLSSCAPAATDAELTQMCENLVQLRGEIDDTTAEERTAKVEEEFAEREKIHHEQQEAALRGVDGALKGKLEEAGDDEEAKQKLEAEHKETRAGLEKEGADLLAELKAEKEKALAAARQKAADAAAERDEAIKKCKEEATAEGVNQTVAQCRIKAESTDAYWNQCR
jgi:colicin import membrane protein